MDIGHGYMNVDNFSEDDLLLMRAIKTVARERPQFWKLKTQWNSNTDLCDSGDHLSYHKHLS